MDLSVKFVGRNVLAGHSKNDAKKPNITKLCIQIFTFISITGYDIVLVVAAVVLVVAVVLSFRFVLLLFNRGFIIGRVRRRMPGLRNAAGGIRSYASFAPYFPTTTTTTTADMHIPAPPPPQQSWENLVPSSHTNYFHRPSSQQRSVHRPLQWLHHQQQHRREDLRSNFLGTNPNTNTNNNTNNINNQHHQQQQPRHPLISHGSNDSDDLQAMVHDFIENDSVDYMDGTDSDGAPPSLKLTDNLQVA